MNETISPEKLQDLDRYDFCTEILRAQLNMDWEIDDEIAPIVTACVEGITEVLNNEQGLLITEFKNGRIKVIRNLQDQQLGSNTRLSISVNEDQSDRSGLNVTLNREIDGIRENIHIMERQSGDKFKLAFAIHRFDKNTDGLEPANSNIHFELEKNLS